MYNREDRIPMISLHYAKLIFLEENFGVRVLLANRPFLCHILCVASVQFNCVRRMSAENKHHLVQRCVHIQFALVWVWWAKASVVCTVGSRSISFRHRKKQKQKEINLNLYSWSQLVERSRSKSFVVLRLHLLPDAAAKWSLRTQCAHFFSVTHAISVSFGSFHLTASLTVHYSDSDVFFICFYFMRITHLHMLGLINTEMKLLFHLFAVLNLDAPST